MIRKIFRFFFRKEPWLTFLVIFTGLICLLITVLVIIPAWKQPINRTYTSKFGYASLMRAAKKPFPVVTSIVEEKELEHFLLGDGVMASKPILVPIVPIERVSAVYVKEGDFVHKDDLLAEINTGRLDLKVQSARLAVETSTAEFNRVRIGSAYVLAQERPQKDIIDENTANEKISLQEQRIAMNQQLYDKGLISKQDMIGLKGDLIESKRDLSIAQFNKGMSEQGVKQSLTIAENAVKDAEISLSNRLEELKGYKIYALADGIVQNVLINPGEFNQDSGKPGFVIASGAWFEAHFDQAGFSAVKVGDPVELFIEACPGMPIPGRVQTIVPLVSYDSGGPESTRPLRPLGTGAPEWPSTFTVRIAAEPPEGVMLVPGFTGFCRVKVRERGMVVPQGAITSISAGSGLVNVLSGDQREVRQVETGTTAGGMTQVRHGLAQGEEVIVEGQVVLREKDAILRETKKPAGS